MTTQTVPKITEYILFTDLPDFCLVSGGDSSTEESRPDPAA